MEKEYHNSQENYSELNGAIKGLAWIKGTGEY